MAPVPDFTFDLLAYGIPYLEPDVDNFLKKIAQDKNIDVQILVNEWLRNNIKLIESIQ